MPSQVPTQTISTRFPPDTLERLEEISRNQNRTRSEIINEAVNAYLDAMLWLDQAVARGMEDLRQGRSISHEAIKEKYRKLGVHVD